VDRHGGPQVEAVVPRLLAGEDAEPRAQLAPRGGHVAGRPRHAGPDEMVVEAGAERVLRRARAGPLQETAGLVDVAKSQVGLGGDQGQLVVHRGVAGLGDRVADLASDSCRAALGVEVRLPPGDVRASLPADTLAATKLPPCSSRPCLRHGPITLQQRHLGPDELGLGAVLVGALAAQELGGPGQGLVGLLQQSRLHQHPGAVEEPHAS
jgi:hypothetical protein